VRHPHLKSDIGKDGSPGDPRASDATVPLAIVPGKVAPIDDYRAVMAQRAIFQSIASMGLPAFTIHSVVRYSGQALKGAKNTIIRTWGPIGVSPRSSRLNTLSLIHCSWGWPLYLSYPIYSINQSNMLLSGLSTKALKPLAVQEQSIASALYWACRQVPKIPKKNYERSMNGDIICVIGCNIIPPLMLDLKYDVGVGMTTAECTGWVACTFLSSDAFCC
jgi:hypothetical protein